MSATVLVVEDNPIMRRMLRLTLETAGYQVTETSDGESAISCAAAGMPDAVILDLVLPDMDGRTLLAELRGMPAGRSMPAIALSGLAQRLDEARDSNFDAFLVKPVEPSRLLDTLRALLPQRQRDSAPRGARVLVVDDDRVQRNLLALRLRDIGYQVDCAADGAGALTSAVEHRPAAIVSDVLMPGIDGFKLCRMIRTDPRFDGVPVVLTSSAYVERGDRELARNVGASALVERTPQMTELLEELGHCLENPLLGAPDVSDQAVERHHAERVLRQVERQAAINSALSQQNAIQSVELSMLSTLSQVMTRDFDAERVLAEVLARCLEATGATLGAAYLREPDGTIRLAGHAGGADAAQLEDFYGEAKLLGEAVETCATVELPTSGRHAQEGAAVLAQASLASMLIAPLSANGDVRGALVFGMRSGALSRDQMTFVRAVAAQTAQGLALARTVARLAHSQQETIERLARAAEFHDRDTAQHNQRVSRYAELIARRYGCSPQRTELIRLASMMHDVGKIGISDKILLKPGPLTQEERAAMELHAHHGYRILASADDELLALAARIALTHHERWDGRGYPNGLAGAEIPVEGRITAIADVFDALTSNRVYRAAMSTERAIDILRSERGAQFDAELVDIFLGALPEVFQIMERYADPQGAPLLEPLDISATAAAARS